MLEDVYDQIEPQENDDSILHTEEFAESVMFMMETYIEENPTIITEPDFHETMMKNIRDLTIAQFNEEIPFYEEDNLDDMLDEISELFYHTFMPHRSHPESIIVNMDPDKERIQKQIDILSKKPQPTQRTSEWYEFRHNLITASNAYKAFEDGCARDQLIYEKCQPLHIPTQVDESEKTFVNVNTTLHWGQKYEPLSVMIYEDMFKTKIQDFGCIQHDEYSFIGASPDGINVDPNNLRYGRMLEIKNIVNREIDGIPKTEYWIQMQLQMETCDLDECDFLETKFVEYEDEASYYDEPDESKYRGVIMYFSDGSRPHYLYAPLHQTKESWLEWEEKMMKENYGKTWIKNCYWKAEIVSCVLVQRNRRWFQDNVGKMQEVWSIIENERVSGFQHRAPNKRLSKKDVEQQGSGNCMLNIDKNTGKISIQVIKIRTESFDDTKKKLLLDPEL